MNTNPSEIFDDLQDRYTDAIKQLTQDPNIIEVNRQNFRVLNAEICSHFPEIQETINLWSDKASQIQYLNFLKYSIMAKVHKPLALAIDQNMPQVMLNEMFKHSDAIVAKNGLQIPNVSMTNDPKDVTKWAIFFSFAVQQYRYPKLVEIEPGDIFIDCGAFIGETSLWAMQKGATAYIFEPIAENLEDTKHNLRQNGFSDDNCYQLAVGDQNQDVVIKMHPQCKDSSFIPCETPSINTQEHLKPYINEMIDVTIKSVRLDDFCKEHDISPTFIKMDIEGFELAALQGAEEIIRTRHPKLAICLYHKDSDLWEIPLYLKRLVPEYKFFCRENSTASEFVLYATV